jgi:SAM-dependent methyltransferase
MLFDRENDDFGSDVATRALSVTAVETDFVARVYEKQASWYDLWFGPTLHHGRLVAIERMGIAPDDCILEVGVGTGINTSLYPQNCHVTGIDLSSQMLEKARDRVAEEGLRNIRLLEMMRRTDARGRLVRYRLRAIPDQRRPDPAGREGNAPRLPAGDHRPESFRSANPILRASNGNVFVHRPRRFPGRTWISRASSPRPIFSPSRLRR